MINFGMLGLLRRLHRLHIQFALEAESDITGIQYPCEAHKSIMGKRQLVIPKYSQFKNGRQLPQ